MRFPSFRISNLNYIVGKKKRKKWNSLKSAYSIKLSNTDFIAFSFLLQIDLIGTSAYDVIHPEDHQTFHDLLCSAFQKSTQDYMKNMMDFDGNSFFFDWFQFSFTIQNKYKKVKDSIEILFGTKPNHSFCLWEKYTSI